MILLKKKKLYTNLIKQKNLYAIYTYNRILNQKKYNLKQGKTYIISIKTQEQNNLYEKEIFGILIKKSKVQNLTNLHLLCLKRYNNIYLSFYKESPNIIIKYNKYI